MVIADGVTIHRIVRDLDTLLPVDEPAPGQRMLVSLVGMAFADENLDYVVADLLPTGYEVEQTGLPASVMIVGGQVGQCPSGKASLAPAVCTLGDDMGFQQSGTEYAEARADRVLFGFQTGKGQVAHHYVVRRTQGGLVTQPGASGAAPSMPTTTASTTILVWRGSPFPNGMGSVAPALLSKARMPAGTARLSHSAAWCCWIS